MAENIRFERIIKHPLQKVWEAISQEKHIKEWFAEADFKAEKGYHYKLTEKARDDWDGILHGEIKEVKPPYFLSYTFLSNELDHETLVTWKLSEHPEGTLVQLEHNGIDKLTSKADFMQLDITKGWTSCLNDLEKHLNSQ